MASEKPCGICSSPFIPASYNQKFCSNSCRQKAKILKANKHWEEKEEPARKIPARLKGKSASLHFHNSNSKTKYPQQTVNGKKDRVHRHVMEEHLGRVLETHEHIYHLNGDGFDNRIENLVLIEKKPARS